MCAELAAVLLAVSDESINQSNQIYIALYVANELYKYK